jgi:hypothetical protein
MRELVSVTTVPPEGAAALRVTVQVAEPPLPPAITDGLQAREAAVCAKALVRSGVQAIKPNTTATRNCFVDPPDFMGFSWL